MFPSFLLSVREAAEAALVVGLVLGMLRRLGRLDCARVVWAGLAAGTATGGLAFLAFRAFGLGAAASAEPVFEGTTLLAAAGLLTWVVFWMAKQSRGARAALEQRVLAATCGGGGRAVFLLTFVAVAREGVELAFFLTAVSLTTSLAHVLMGAALGLAVAAAAAWALFASTLQLDLRRFFQVTGAVLIVFAAGLVAKGLAEYNEAGWLPGVIDPLWDSSRVLSEGSFLGGAARVLLGYTSAPSLTVVLGYVGYLAVVTAGGMRSVIRRRPAAPKLPVYRLGASPLEHGGR